MDDSQEFFLKKTLKLFLRRCRGAKRLLMLKSLFGMTDEKLESHIESLSDQIDAVRLEIRRSRKK